MPFLWSCDWTRCESPAAQGTGDCLLCDRLLCRAHLRDEGHTYPKPETNWNEYSTQYAAAESRRLDKLHRRIDGRELRTRASQVRGGDPVPCTVDLSRKKLSAMMGGQNCLAEVVFADGVVWLARLRLSSPISPPPPEVREYVLRSEAATMEYLQRHTRAPSPRVFDWACESDPANTVGVGCILMEKPQGAPLDWQGATTAQREKVVRQLAEIMLEIARHPFDTLGSLVAKTATSGEDMKEALATSAAAAAGAQKQIGALVKQRSRRRGGRKHLSNGKTTGCCRQC